MKVITGILILLSGLILFLPTKSISATFPEHCRNPQSLDMVLECRSAFWKDNGLNYEVHGHLGPSWFYYGVQNSCRYLPQAIAYLQSQHDNPAKDFVVIAVMSQLPIRDYVSTWGPALLDAHNRGTIRTREAIDGILPDHGTRGDFYFAWKEKLVIQYLDRVSKNEKLFLNQTVKEVLSGQKAQSILSNFLAPIDIKFPVVDLKTSCAKLNESGVAEHASKHNLEDLISILYTDPNYDLWYQGGSLVRYLYREKESSLRLLRNTIYARHNYDFSDKKLTNYFTSHFRMYSPSTREVALSDTEKANIQYIKRIEAKLRFIRIGVWS